MSVDPLRGLSRQPERTEETRSSNLLLELPPVIFGEMASWLDQRGHNALRNIPEARKLVSSAVPAIKEDIRAELQKIITFFQGKSDPLNLLHNLQEEINKILSRLELYNQSHIEHQMQVRLFQFLCSLSEESFESLANFRGSSLHRLHFDEMRQIARDFRELLSETSEQGTQDESSRFWFFVARNVGDLQEKLIKTKGLLGFGLALECTKAMREKAQRTNLRGAPLPLVYTLWENLRSYLVEQILRGPFYLHRTIDQIADLIFDEEERNYWFSYWIIPFLNRNGEMRGVDHALEKIPDGECKRQTQKNLDDSHPSCQIL